MQGISDLEAFHSSLLVRDAVERRLAIIGEAAYKLRKLGIALSQSDQLINRRNTLIHRYDDFSVRSVWVHIRQDLPALKQEVDKLLEGTDAG
ncbi:MAG: hypothetical protein OHK0039_08190 [Bacteroidia bacterium]